MRFNGSDYQPDRDDDRLSVQYLRIFRLMEDSVYRTLADISRITDDPPASVSAQLRHMRKPRFGCHTVNKRYLGNGLYEYQLVPNKLSHVLRARQTRDHKCHWPECDKQVPPALWGCARHWAMLPQSIRSRIWREYRAGQEEDMRPSSGYISAAQEAQEWIARKGPL